MNNLDIPKCPTELPPALKQAAVRLAEEWMRSDCRPQPKALVLNNWRALIDKWIASKLPLYVRKHRGDRGSIINHDSGRILIPVDNSFSHWTYSLALAGKCPSLDEIASFIEEDRVPVAMAFKKDERSRAKYICTRIDCSLNARGWKVCHIEPVGIGYGNILVQHSISKLHDHFNRLSSPSNMFLVPIKWSGLGEMPEMISIALKHRTTQ